MALLQRGLLVMATAGALAIPAYVPETGVVAPNSGDRTVLKSDGQAFSPTSIEFYLDADTVGYIRPGLNVTIGTVTNFAPGQKPTVQLTILDDLKQPLDITGGTTPGVISLRFVPATWDAAKRTYTDLLTVNGNPSRDNAGTWTDLGGGKYSYTFALALQATGWDAASPATLAVVGSRNLTSIIGKNYYVNQWKDFVPSTGADATGKVWAQTTNTMCTNCHDPLTFTGSNWPHGGNYRSIRTCVLCHNKSNMTGAALAEFNGQRFFHQTHAGLNEYPGPEITYPQPINNCDGCHDKAAPNGATWNMFPGQIACGSCHVSLDFTKHAGGQNDDSKCATCHVPDSGKEWDISVTGAHVQEWQSKQQLGLKATIVSVSNVKAGSAPTVVIKVTDSKGVAQDGSKLSTFAPMFAGSTADYGNGTWPAANHGYIRETAGTKAVFDAASGNTSYTFTGKIPADLTGSVVFSADIYKTETLLNADGSVRNAAYRDCATNPIYYYNLSTGSQVTTVANGARRSAVTIAQCNKCHDHLALHGGQRLVTDECAICHNPTENDGSRRPASANPVESIDGKRMIHRIHTGVDATQDITIYGFGGSVNNFNEVTFPGDRRNCAVCHTSTGYYPSTDPARLSTPTPRDFFTPQGPTTAACLGCHDARAFAAHAYLNTAPFGEACQACHGAGNAYGVDVVHAR